MNAQERFQDYLRQLRTPFQKLCRLRFLQPDGSVAYVLDNNPRNARAGAFIAEGEISGAWRNGRRRSASVTLANMDGEFDFKLGGVWFGSEIALDEGLILSDGSEFYIQQGVFLVENPVEDVRPEGRVARYDLVDKTAFLDGSLGGKLDGDYEVEEGTNIFEPVVALLEEDRGNGLPVDRVKPVFTEYYNGKTQLLPDGSEAYLTDAPYTLTVDGDGGTKWEVIEGLAAMVNGWVGYDETGALRIDPSQDDILDADKPVLWRFSMEEAQLLGMAYTVKNTEVFNDFIVVGEQLSDGFQPSGRAQILDTASPVCIQEIGRKTTRVTQAGFATDTQCRDYAEWMVKRSSILQRAVNVECTQMFHLRGNDVVEIVRNDKAGSPVERHLVQGWSRPLANNGAMTITAVSVQDFPVATVV